MKIDRFELLSVTGFNLFKYLPLFIIVSSDTKLFMIVLYVFMSDVLNTFMLHHTSKCIQKQITELENEISKLKTEK
jgi:hypothetical protein